MVIIAYFIFYDIILNMKKKMIIFDFDGTLWDTTDLFFLFIQNKIKTQISVAEVRELYVHNIVVAFENLAKSYGLKSPEEIEKITLSYIKDKLNSSPFSHIQEMLGYLTEIGFNLAIVTVAKKINCLPLLQKYDCEKYFQYIYTRDDFSIKTESVGKILEKENLKIEEIIFVTDTLGDVREMNVLGVETIAVTYGLHDRTFFEREKNENLIAIVNTVEELKNKLLELI